MKNSESQQQPLKIDIISDISCPWCVVGYRQLAEALEKSNTAYEIHWHPFELNPDMPAEGKNLREHSAKKHGRNNQEIQASRDRMTAAGSEIGFKFNFNEDTRVHNTFNMHQLIYWADQYSLANNLEQALFAAYFTDNRNLSDKSVLADIAAEVGLDRTEALTVLEDQRFAQEVRESEQRARKQGIQSVPTVIFNDQHMVSGAQGVENYTNILQQLANMSD
ncbi:DsbA family oxidoreductase [Psychrobacter frigidicola]|uniref:DsbA family oxidoreductase n=1 Tax=Psychrobacter frigidicola TaxID=45611 RepID=A0A5C7A5M3_9GAMM|nr:DsbA family oxidoreductase [Psychrobacter frigidicola]TXD97854.1 DsbA family oxidoreductase [Psychrobacter frigidicola]